MVGAEYYIGEKIGNRKQSSGEVAFFSGSTRRGKGSYIALASESGPRGREYLSVGQQPNGFYGSDTAVKSNAKRGFGETNAFEMRSPVVSYETDTISVVGESGDTVEITARTENPDSCVATRESW